MVFPEVREFMEDTKRLEKNTTRSGRRARHANTHDSRPARSGFSVFPCSSQFRLFLPKNNTPLPLRERLWANTARHTIASTLISTRSHHDTTPAYASHALYTRIHTGPCSHMAKQPTWHDTYSCGPTAHTTRRRCLAVSRNLSEGGVRQELPSRSDAASHRACHSATR